MLFVEWSSSSMLEAGDGQPPSHLSQLRSAEQAPVACASSREVQTRGSNTMICGDKQRLKKSRVFLIDRFAQGHSTSCAQNTKQGESPAALETQPWDLVTNPGGARRPGENEIERDIGRADR